MGRVLLHALILAGLLSQGARARQQMAPPEMIPAARVVFEDGLEAFEAASWELALRRFDQVQRDFSFNTLTTAARLMSGKTLYRLQRFDQVVELLESFATDFPTSRYVNEAARLVALAREAQERSAERPVNIGVLFSLDRQQVGISQSVFHGIRFAADDHNESGSGTGIRLVFRDMGTEAATIRAAMRELASQNVDAVIGTVYSEDAIVAAREAERLNLVFIAPLATDERVSEGKRYAFQANPTIAVRGELMARFAVRGLLLRRLGVIAVADEQGLGERLSDAFVQEASRLGAQINLIKLLHQESEWSALPDSVARDTLLHVDAIYAPMSTDNPVRFAASILDAMDRFGSHSEGVRILGNTPWHELPLATQASTYGTTYSNDFYLPEGDGEVEAFNDRYRRLAGLAPQRPAYTGYDVMSFLAEVLERRAGRSLDDAMRESSEFSGLGMRFHFDGTNVNRGLFYHRYRDGHPTLLR